MIKFHIFQYCIPNFCYLFYLAAASNPTENSAIIFRDDFSSFDESKWNRINHRGEVNHELEYYSPDDIAVQNGVLSLKVDHRQIGNNSYTSGRVTTKGKFSFLYGNVEWRTKIPHGQGIWAALYLYQFTCDAGIPCDSWPPAICGMNTEGNQPNNAIVAVWYKDEKQQPVSSTYTYTARKDLGMDFHVYSVDWSRERIIWFIDQVEVYREEQSLAIPTVPMQLDMSISVGGSGSDAPNATDKFPQEFLIDYVIVRQLRNETNSTVSATASVSPQKQSTVIALAVVIPISGGLLFGAVILWALRRRRQRLLHGNMEKRFSSDSQSSVLTDLSSQNYKRKDSINHNIDVELKKLMDLLQIPLANLQLSNTILGEGEYGIVCKGTATGLRGVNLTETIVAVKAARAAADIKQQQALCEEIKIMSKVGRHLNIVNLLGIATSGGPLLLLEFCQFGSLLLYLRSHRGPFAYVHVDEEGHYLEFDDQEFQRRTSAASSSGKSAKPNAACFDDTVLSTKDLIHFAYQISRGMEYLAARSIIHRDLAARNVLVCEEKIVKIADFGLARQRETEYILGDLKVALPFKWMAPETMTKRSFTQKSDVWSFSILLWELFSYGEVPYSTTTIYTEYISELLDALMKNKRMTRPDGCPNNIFELMEQCWQTSPDDRPPFKHIRTQLQSLTSPGFDQYYLTLDEPYRQYNQEHHDLLSLKTESESSYQTALPPKDTAARLSSTAGCRDPNSSFLTRVKNRVTVPKKLATREREPYSVHFVKKEILSRNDS